MLVIHPTAPLSSISALVTTIAGFASSHLLDYASYLVSGTARSPSTRGVPVLPLEVLEDRQFELGFLAATVPHLCAKLLAPEGDLDALDIPIPRNHAEAVSGPWASYWIAAEEAKMASYWSTGTYADAVPPPGTNVVTGMWLYKVKRPPGSPPVFKARYVARGFTQRDYKLHSLDFSTSFLQGSLHEQIWLRRPPGFTSSFPPRTQWQLRQPVNGLRQAPREWHHTLRTTLAAFEFFPLSANPSLFVRRGSTPFFVFVYIDNLVFATPDRHALASVKEELQRRHTCTDLGELQRYLGLHITRDRAARTCTQPQSHMQGGSWNLCLGAEEMLQGSGDAAEKRNEPPPSDIEALDGSNYEEWSGRMRSAFKCYKLLKIAMGEEKIEEEGDARDWWIEKSAVLYDLIVQSVKNDMFQHIKDLVELDDSGPKAWKLLCDVIQPNTLPMVILLEKEMAALSMRPGDNVKPVLDKIKDTYVRMAAAGSNVSQMQQCTKIISVLDNSWDNLIPTLNTQQDQWTPEWLRQQILQEDFCRRHMGDGAANKTAEG
ncbi:unnamed protein product [Closterium sp. NIES-54]